jgi:hypothetical protein
MYEIYSSGCYDVFCKQTAQNEFRRKFKLIPPDTGIKTKKK